MTTVEYLAEWFVREMWEVRIDEFNPPDEFVEACVTAMICLPGWGWPADDREGAREELTSYWPDYRADLPADIPF